MSENDNNPPTPSKQTASVPLKKETVRVTLKAADAPPAAPTASTPPPAPVRPPVPTAPPAPPAPTVGGAPRPPAPAPTIPLRTAGAPGAPGAAAPAPTIRLATSTAPVGAGTSALRPGGVGLPPGGTTGLPKATVPLQQPMMASPSQMATLRVEDEEDDEERGDGLAKALAIASFVVALVVLGLQLKTAGIWINAEDNPDQGSWGQLF